MVQIIARAAFAMFLLSLAPFTSLTLAADQEPSSAEPLRFGITPVFLVDQAPFLEGWKGYLERHLGRAVTFVRRHSYAEITDMLANGQLDAAWICSLSYALNRARLQLLATPVNHGEPYYRSYLLVPASDQSTRGYEGMGNKVFAYVEPRSLTGYFYPRHVIRQLGIDPNGYFRDTFFTWSHLDSIEAVAEEFAEASAVDGYIWESLRLKDSTITDQTRVVAKSQRFGFPPIVAGRSLTPIDRAGLEKAIFAMHEDEEGRRLLAVLNLDRFMPPRAELYDDISAMIRSRDDDRGD